MCVWVGVRVGRGLGLSGWEREAQFGVRALGHGPGGLWAPSFPASPVNLSKAGLRYGQPESLWSSGHEALLTLSVSSPVC